MSEGRAFEAHETEMRRRRIVVDVEADRAEETLVVFEDAICAKTTLVGSVTNGVEDEREVLGDAATVARSRRRRLFRLHRRRRSID